MATPPDKLYNALLSWAQREPNWVPFEYCAIPFCPKCKSSSIGKQFDTRMCYDARVRVELLLLSCRECSYRWHTLCADAKLPMNAEYNRDKLLRDVVDATPAILEREE